MVGTSTATLTTVKIIVTCRAKSLALTQAVFFQRYIALGKTQTTLNAHFNSPRPVILWYLPGLLTLWQEHGPK